MKIPAACQVRRFCPLAAAVTASMLLSACGDADPAANAVDDASRTLRTMGVSQNEAGPAAAFDRAASELSGVSDGGEVAKSAAAVLLAEAQHGQAAAPNVALLEADIEFRRLLTEAGEAFNDRQRAHARAAAAVAYDPSADMDRLRAEAQVHRREAAELATQRETLAARLDDLSSRYTALESEAQQLRLEAANIELSLTGRSAREAAARAPEIRELTRRADLLQKDALGLRAQAEMLQPSIDEVTALVAQREEQADLALQAVAAAEARQRAAQEEAIEARANAQDAERRVIELLGEARTIRNETIEPVGEETISTLNKANSSAGRGASGLRTTSRMTRAGVQRSLGTVHDLLGEHHLRWAGFLGQLAAAQPAMSNASSLASEAEAAQAAGVQHLTAAADAYEASAEDIAGAGARGIDREKIDAAASTMNELAASLRARIGGGEASQAPAAQPGDGMSEGADGE